MNHLLGCGEYKTGRINGQGDSAEFTWVSAIPRTTASSYTFERKSNETSTPSGQSGSAS